MQMSCCAPCQLLCERRAANKLSNWERWLISVPLRLKSPTLAVVSRKNYKQETRKLKLGPKFLVIRRIVDYLLSDRSVIKESVGKLKYENNFLRWYSSISSYFSIGPLCGETLIGFPANSVCCTGTFKIHSTFKSLIITRML